MADDTDRLTLARLADECDVDERYVEQLVELGIVEPSEGAFSWTDVWRVGTMDSLERAGMSLERMAPHFQSGRLSLSFLETMLPPPAPRTGRTTAEFEASLGEHGALVGTVYEMLGLIRPAADAQLREDEERVVRELIELWGDDPDILKRAARVAGHAIRLIVEGWTGLHYELYRKLGGGGRERWSPELREREMANAGRALRLAESIPMWLTTRHYEQVLYSDIIENIEMVIDPFEERRSDQEGIRQPTIVFVDLSGFTAMVEAEGDRAAAAATSRFEEEVSLASLRQSGRVVKLLGDGALLAFPEPLPALRATIAIRSALKPLPLRPHAGIECGPIAERDGDVFGRTVNMASRLASAASAGQIVVSARVAVVATDAGLQVEDLGRLQLKGVDAPMPAFAIAEERSPRLGPAGSIAADASRSPRDREPGDAPECN